MGFSTSGYNNINPKPQNNAVQSSLALKINTNTGTMINNFMMFNSIFSGGVSFLVALSMSCSRSDKDLPFSSGMVREVRWNFIFKPNRLIDLYAQFPLFSYK